MSESERAGAIKASKGTKTSAENFDVDKMTSAIRFVSSAKRRRSGRAFVFRSRRRTTMGPPDPSLPRTSELSASRSLRSSKEKHQKYQRKDRKSPLSLPLSLSLLSLSLTIIDTSETCDESIACRPKPVAEQSKLASVTSSLTASRSFLSRAPCSSRASNMVGGGEDEGFEGREKKKKERLESGLKHLCKEEGF